MHRLVVAALTASALGTVSAWAEPLPTRTSLNAAPRPAIAAPSPHQDRSAQRTETRLAYAERPQYGGGFLEVLFGGFRGDSTRSENRSAAYPYAQGDHGRTEYSGYGE